MHACLDGVLARRKFPGLGFNIFSVVERFDEGDIIKDCNEDVVNSSCIIDPLVVEIVC